MSVTKPSDTYSEYSPFKWDEQRSQAAVELAMGYSWQKTADKVGVIKKTIGNWMQHPEFAAEVDRLTLMVGISAKAERLRLIMRVIRQKTADDGSLITKADVIDWMKLAKDELTTVGILGLAAMQSEAVAQQDVPPPTPPSEPELSSEQVS